MEITRYSLLLLTFILLSCGQKQKEEIIIVNQPVTVPVLQDAGFANGVTLIGTSSADPDPLDTLYPFGNSDRPVYWRLAQWGSRHNLLGTERLQKGDSTIYANPGKKLSFVDHGGETTIVLSVFASREFNKARQANEDWPHLLLEQKIDNTILLNTMDSLHYGIQARLNFCQDLMSPETFNPDLHTAQMTFYLAIQDVNEQSAGKTDYFWFGLPLYDYRYPVIAVYAAQDRGKEDATQKFIYTAASTNLFQTSMHEKQWIHIQRDIYPTIKEAFRTAKERGFLKNTKWEDLAISGMNLGWEVPGTFDCEIALKNLQLQAKLKPTL